MQKPISQSYRNKQNGTKSLLIFLIGLAIISTVGLDFINWQKNKSSFLFSRLIKRTETLSRPEFLHKILQKNLIKAEIPIEAVHKHSDADRTIHIKIDLEMEKFIQLSSVLEEEFSTAGAVVNKKDSRETPEMEYHLWLVDAEQARSLSILFASKKDKTVRPFSESVEGAVGKVALIIDDMGYSLEAIDLLSSLKLPVTISILPHSPYARETAEIARKNHLEVILHLPLEPLNNNHETYDDGGLILSTMEEQEIIELLDENFEMVPFITGTNNHMGSKITADNRIMSIILRSVLERNLFFIDSRTTAQSVAYSLAQKMGIPSAKRDVFLDGERDEDYITGKLQELFNKARRTGVAVGICHPHPETLKVLKNSFHLVKEYKLQPVFASEIVR
ncbi:MAG: divergent polysaccharide deacetylase family protein [Candidatus Aminicenantes bacterium]|nr:divergent polysaccharide deacetylase family protein [Candidatus Aminicenantes bacterium]